MPASIKPCWKAVVKVADDEGRSGLRWQQPSALLGGRIGLRQALGCADHDQRPPIFVFRRRLHLISREIERDAVILVGAGRKVERELRSWQPCICPTRRSPQNERDETQLKPKKPRDEIIRIGSCAILLVHRETNPIRARH